MIISCPECSGPFQIPEEHIAALVQVACPHCEFRMILDFAAANDASLIESGMKMASGFRSAADYSAAVAAPAARVAPTSEPASVPQTAAPGKRTGTTHVGPLPGPPSEAPAAETGVGDLDYEDEAPTTLHHSGTHDLPEERAPRRTAAVAADAGPKVSAAELAAAASAEAASANRQTVEVDPPVAEAMVKGVDRAPPHTPPQPRAVPSSSDSGQVPATRADASDDLDLYDDEQRSNPIATVALVAMLLLCLGLVAASVALEGTPDPRPLLQDLYLQSMKQ